MCKKKDTLIDLAVLGDKAALEELIICVKDGIYNLSLRMLGTIQDAEDATQEIIIRIITSLSSFRKESAFSTWVFRIAKNYLLSYQKSMFAKRPLSFEFYGEDIKAGYISNTQELTHGVSEALLSEELKLSCTNVMLQCLDPESRLIYVLGIMLRADSTMCGDILGITPQAYRQRLSRIRKRVASFLYEYCGLTNTGCCNCKKRVGYAIQNHRLNPDHLEYSRLETLDEKDALGFTQAMEEMDNVSYLFASLPKYRSPDFIKDFLQNLIKSDPMRLIRAES